jgi:hypothetical protein
VILWHNRHDRRVLFRDAVQFEVKAQDVDPRFATQAKLALDDVIPNELVDPVCRGVAGFGDSRGLKEGGVGGNPR